MQFLFFILHYNGENEASELCFILYVGRVVVMYGMRSFGCRDGHAAITASSPVRGIGARTAGARKQSPLQCQSVQVPAGPDEFSSVQCSSS